jgi:hypothetical protein
MVVVLIRVSTQRLLNPKLKGRWTMAGFSCAACGAEFETQERLDEHVRKEHPGVQQDAGSTHTRAGGQQDQVTKSAGEQKA